MTDHRDPLAREVYRVVPPRGVKAGAGKTVQPGDRRPDGIDQRTVPRHEHARGEFALARRDAPSAVRGIPHRLLELVAKQRVFVEAEVVGGVAQVLEDLLLLAVAARPVGVGRERQRVHVAANVARSARVGVVTPHPAHVIAALDSHEIADAAARQPRGHRDPGEPRPSTATSTWRIGAAGVFGVVGRSLLREGAPG